MSTQVRLRRGTTAQHSAFTGALAEVTYDSDKKTLVVHDNATPGGVPLARADQQTGGSLGYLSETFTADRAVVAADIGKVLIANKATAINSTLPSVVTLNSRFPLGYRNIGNGPLTIIPNGAETIDGASTLVLETGASQILVATSTGWRTVLAPSLATVIHAATSKAAIADADEFGFWDNVSGLLRKLLLTDLIAAIFKTTRKIANAAFQDDVTFYSASGLTKGFKFVASGITAGVTRLITLADRDVDFNNIPTAWTAYTPTITGHGTPTNVSARYRRVGANGEFDIRFKSGVSTGVLSAITLPSGLAVAAAVTTRASGEAVVASAAGATTLYPLWLGGDAFINIGAQNASNGGLVPANATGVANSGTDVSISASIPIQGWNV